MKPEITFEEFLEIESKLDIQYGYIAKIEPVEKSKMLKLSVNFGRTEVSMKTILCNIGNDDNTISELLNSIRPFILNFAPREMKGIISEGMIFLPSRDGKPVLTPYIGDKLL